MRAVRGDVLVHPPEPHRRIERHRDRAGEPRAEERVEEGGLGPEHDGDPVARRDAERRERARRRARPGRGPRDQESQVSRSREVDEGDAGRVRRRARERVRERRVARRAARAARRSITARPGSPRRGRRRVGARAHDEAREVGERARPGRVVVVEDRSGSGPRPRRRATGARASRARAASGSPAAGGSPSSSSSSRAMRRISRATDRSRPARPRTAASKGSGTGEGSSRSPPEQDELGREAGAHRGEQADVAGPGVLRVEEVAEHEQHRGGREVSDLAQRTPGALERRVRERRARGRKASITFGPPVWATQWRTSPRASPWSARKASTSPPTLASMTSGTFAERTTLKPLSTTSQPITHSVSG